MNPVELLDIEEFEIVVKNLLQQRQEMLVLFCEVAGLDPFPHGKSDSSILQEFCQVLIDYVAMGHFAFYQQFIENHVFPPQITQTIQTLYPQIFKFTLTAVDFDERYDTLEKCQQLTNLDQELCELGQALALRIELEDHLIRSLKVFAIQQLKAA